MKCMACGADFEGQGTCPVCGFQAINVVGNLTDEMKNALEQAIIAHRNNLLKDMKVFVRAYYWEDQNGEPVKKGYEDILIGQELDQMTENQSSWSSLVFAKQPAGAPVDLTVVVENASGRQLKKVQLTAPDTEEMWKAGMVLKEGLQVVIRIGTQQNYADSNPVSLLG